VTQYVGNTSDDEKRFDAIVDPRKMVGRDEDFSSVVRTMEQMAGV